MPGWTTSGGNLKVSVENTISLDESDKARWISCNAASAIMPDIKEDGFVGSISPAFPPEVDIAGVGLYIEKPGKGVVRAEIYSVDRYNMPVEKVLRSVGFDISNRDGFSTVVFPPVQLNRAIIGLDFSEVEKMPSIYWMISNPNGFHSWAEPVSPAHLFVGMPGPVGKRFAPALSIKVVHNG